MKRTLKLFIAFCLLLSGLEGFSQNLSNRGREFWVSYPFNWFFENGNSQEMVLYFSAEEDATVTLTSHVFATTWTRVYNVTAGTVVSTETATPIGGAPGPLVPGYIPKSGTYDARLYDLAFPAGNGGQGLYQKGIHIESTAPIVAYAHYTGSATSGAAMLFPVEAYGYVYTTLNNANSYASQPSNTYFYIMASHDNTVVEITPKVLTRAEMPAAPGGRPPGVPFTVALNKGQSFQVISNVMAGDLTGSKIRSIANASGECWPIAVFSGTSRTGLSCAGPGGGSGDFIMQQCFPSQAWGKRYLTAPTSNSAAPATLSTNIYRILVKDPTTQVRKNGVLMTGLINGDYYQYNSNTADYIVSDKPIQVAQYMSSSGACANTGGLGDPEMIYISPVEQAIKRIGFFRNNRERIEVNYLTLIVPSGGTGLSSLTIDGIPFASLPAAVKHSYPHPNLPGYQVIVRRWSGFALPPSAPPGQCIVQSDSAFTAITYGQGSVESYGYNAGTMINNLNAISSIQNTLDPTTQEHRFTCTNTPVRLSALMAYPPTRMEWRLSTLGTDITPNADVIDNAPVSAGTVVVNGITYYKYTLPGTYMFNRADTFEIPIRATHPSIENCNNTEEVKIKVIVKEKPKADFTFTHTGCTLDTARFHGVTNTSDGYTLNTWNWTFPGPVTASGQDVNQVIAPGTHTINLSVVTTEGCASDTSKQIVVHPKPTTSFTSVPPNICEDGSITFTPNSNYADPTLLNGWYWDFGNGTTTAPTGAAQTHLYPDYGTYTVKHVVKYGNLCISDTATTVVTIWAKPRMGFTYPVGCLPVGGQVQFTSTATIPDGQTFGSHNWNFGDPNANAGNPNTSTLQNPTHIYTAYGTYTISYNATTNNGCSADSIVTATFDVRPTLAFTPLAAVCENQAPFSIANGNVTNGVPGTTVYRGPGTNAAGMFNPALAGPGTHTIWYVFTSTAGCADSLSQNILVHARPRANFSIPNGGCLPTSGTVQFTNTSTIADAQTLTYNWNFDDPNANAGNPNTSTAQDPTHNFIDGTYDINLVVNSSNGCIKDTTITATFSVTPLLAYNALAPICENDAPRSVATATVTNGAVGTGVYSGPGTNAAGMFNPTTAGAGNHTITYTYTTAGGCSAIITQTILVHGRPRPNFTYPNGGCLPTSGQVQFTNTSTIPDAQTMSYSWNFDDPNANAGNPNTSTAQDPTHNYIDGTYDIVLTATSSQGCVKDTTITATFSITPLLAYPVLNAVCENDPALSVATATVTNGAVGTGTYSGPGTNAAGMFNPATAGPGNHTITYTYATPGGCQATITQTILVHARPRPNFTFPTGACLAATGLVNFTNTSTIADAQTMTWSWNFNDPNANAGNPNTSTAQHPSHNFGEGTFPVQLTVNSSNGCRKDTTINATFTVTPALAYAALPAICENDAPISVATATVTNAVTGSGVYSGPGTNAAGMFNPATAGPGNHTITYTYTTTGGCTATITQTKQVHARPRANFTFTNGCLGTNGQATFTNTSTIADAQTLAWSWNFNDPNANAGNPNTSTAQHPTHNYAEGTYNVNLQVTSSQGCRKDTTIAATFAVTPAVTFAALAPVCQNPGAAPSSIASGNVTNGVTGNGVYSGPGTNAAGMFDPNAAGPGTHTITYTYTSAGGCVGTATSQVTVYPRPTASFTVSNGGGVCLGQNITLTSTSTIPTGSIAAWNWNLGNSSTPSYTNGNPFTVNYATAQTYTVQLVNISDRGCFSEAVTQTVRISPLPVVNFTLPTGICMPGGNASFTNQTTVPDNSALTYAWDFGDASGTSTNPNPNYVYGAIGSYNVTLTATSAFGCQNSASQTLDDFFDKPIASFTVSPQELCQGADNVFTNTSTAPNSTVTAWAWDFGGAGTSTVANPIKRFNTPGVYNVQLVVTNAVGCKSDPEIVPVTVHLQPVIDAGQSFVVPQGTVVQLTATSNAASGVTYAWTPPLNVSNPTILKPTVTALSDETYTLTATGAFGCQATDFITIKILKPVTVPNIFTPNGDGIHDTWIIPNLVDYPGCTVEVFNRYGQKVLHSAGYGTPWNGTFKGKDMPVGTYYYIIQLQNGFKPMTGSVTIVR